MAQSGHDLVTSTIVHIAQAVVGMRRWYGSVSVPTTSTTKRRNKPNMEIRIKPGWRPGELTGNKKPACSRIFAPEKEQEDFLKS